MSIFGDMDNEELEKVSDNPWSIPDGWYHVVIEKAWESERDGLHYANFTFKVDDPGRDGHGLPVRDRFQVFPGIKSLKELDSDEQREVSKMMKFFLQGCDLSRQEAIEVRYEQLIGAELLVKVKTNKAKDGREFVNVQDHLSMRLADERNITTDEASASVGL